ncbi:MAG: BatA domain-containing protein [Pirellula sp.]
MMFLQPTLLFALPLIVLPIVIHLLNQRRHKSVAWGAMLFLKKAKRMHSGVARLRYWMILAARAAAIAGLIFALARPMTTGWKGGWFGASAQTTIILLDRSPSMEYEDLQSGLSKRATALAKLDTMFQSMEHGVERVLIDSATETSRVVPSGTKVSDMPDTHATSSKAKIPAMLARALEYIRRNQTGPTDIWICSDMQSTNWDSEDRHWDEIQASLQANHSVRIMLLSYPNQDQTNFAIRIDNVKRRTSQHAGRDTELRSNALPNKLRIVSGFEQPLDRDTELRSNSSTNFAELVFDLHIKQTGGSLEKRSVPVVVTMGESSTTFELAVSGRESVQSGLAIPIDRDWMAGAGHVELPADANSMDNSHHFTFADSSHVKSVIVSDDAEIGPLLKLAASIPNSKQWNCYADLLSADQAPEIDWQDTSLIVWHAQLPTGILKERLQQFVDSGKVVLFFPVATVTESASVSAGSRPNIGSTPAETQSFMELSWGDWRECGETEPSSVRTWRGESDLFRNTDGGVALPMTELQIYRSCRVLGNSLTKIAALENGEPLLTKAISARGGVYFCSTLPQLQYSTLSQDGIVLYVMIQRALDDAVRNHGNSANVYAGDEMAEDLNAWRPVTPASKSVLLSDRRNQIGAYERDGRFMAIQRDPMEDDPEIIDRDHIERLLGETRVSYIADRAGTSNSLSTELWRFFVVAMIIAALMEGVLSLPKKSPRSATAKNIATVPDARLRGVA